MENHTKASEAEKEIKEQWSFALLCNKCHCGFSIKRDSSDMNKVNLRKIRCPECRGSVMWDPAGFTAIPVGRSNLNEKASQEAIRMANEMKRADTEAGRDKMVSVRSTQKGKNEGKVEMIPEDVIKSIEQKVAPIIEGNE